MTIKEKVLDFVGLAPATNKDVLCYELASLAADDFVYQILSRQSDLPDRIDSLRCDDCKADHDGKCPNPEDDFCPFSLEQWLDQPCRHDHLIVEVVA